MPWCLSEMLKEALGVDHEEDIQSLTDTLEYTNLTEAAPQAEGLPSFEVFGQASRIPTKTFGEIAIEGEALRNTQNNAPFCELIQSVDTPVPVPATQPMDTSPAAWLPNISEEDTQRVQQELLVIEEELNKAAEGTMIAGSTCAYPYISFASYTKSICPICNIRFTTRLNSHIAYAHQDSPPMSQFNSHCDICFKPYKAVKIHLHKIHQHPHLICTKCGWATGFIKRLNKHEQQCKLK